MKRLLLAVLLVAGCGAAAPTPAPLSLTGTVTLIRGNGVSSNFTGSGTHCQGAVGYDDFRDAMSVVVKDQAGTIVATGVTGTAATAPGGCVMAFTIPAVPDVPFYSVEIGHRGAVTYSKADLVAKGWKLDLTLGS